MSTATTDRAPARPAEEIDLAFQAWIRSGSAEAASAEVGISSGTLRSYKRRQPQRFEAVRLAYEHELAARRQAIAREVVEGLQESALVCRKLLRSDLRESASAESHPSGSTCSNQQFIGAGDIC